MLPDAIKQQIKRAPVPSKAEPCKITINLGGPVIMSYPWIMFDGLLMHLWIECYTPELLEHLSPRNPVDLSFLPIPILKTKAGNTWVYNASCSRFDSDVSTVAKIRKRVNPHDLENLKTRKKNMDTIRGMFKAYDMRLPAIVATKCDFYCKGDRYQIEDLLAGLYGLGKKRAVGYGRVVDVEITTIQQDKSLVHPTYGVNRPIPVLLAQKMNLKIEKIRMLACRPPYWAKTSMEPAIPPGGF